jgi:hypothetical protein
MHVRDSYLLGLVSLKAAVFRDTPPLGDRYIYICYIPFVYTSNNRLTTRYRMRVVGFNPIPPLIGPITHHSSELPPKFSGFTPGVGH